MVVSQMLHTRAYNKSRQDKITGAPEQYNATSRISVKKLEQDQNGQRS